MIEWTEIDLLTCFETEPVIDEDRLWFRYRIELNGYCLVFELWPYDEDVYIQLSGAGQLLPLTEVWLHNCIRIRYERDRNKESLAFLTREVDRSNAKPRTSLSLLVRPEITIDIVQ